MQPASDRRERLGWYLYDWANSAFPTTVAAVILGPYLTGVASAAADTSGFIYPFGIPVHAGAFFPYVVSLSALLQVALLPILGAIADYSRRKKQMLGLCSYLGALATMALYFVDGDDYLLGGGLFLAANLAFGASIVFYNSFLPEIAAPADRDRVSSYGWALGYLGGGFLLAANLFLLTQAETFGLTTAHAARICLASAGLWWAIFATPSLAALRNRQALRHLPEGTSYLSAGFRQLATTLRQARNYPHTLTFLVAYLLYNDGIQTVLALSSQFGQQELGLPLSTLTTAILMVQFVAFLGALGFARLAGWLGTKQTIALSLIVWTGVVTYAYGFLETAGEFFGLAFAIALVLGGSQALSRSLYSQMIPVGQEAEYFALYEVSERGTSWLGPLLYGLALQMTGSYRIAILSLIVFFVIGLAVLTRVDAKQAALEARGTRL